MIRILYTGVLAMTGTLFSFGQNKVEWQQEGDRFGQLPASVQVFQTSTPLDGKPNIAWCVVADLKDRRLVFDTDTSFGRRLTPSQFFERNQSPLLVMNGTFFEFVHNRNLNVVISNGTLRSHNLHSVPQRGKDTLTYLHPFRGVIGIDRKRRADIAWVYTDSVSNKVWASQHAVDAFRDSSASLSPGQLADRFAVKSFGGSQPMFNPWPVRTAIGGGPVLVQNGRVQVTNNEERMFVGKAIDDKHPRTAIGYTRDGKLVMLVVEGRAPGKAEGASLTQLAKMLIELGCVEALNLDGGGSSCMLVNGKETIRPSDKEGQRPVPAVFMIRTKR